MNVYTYYRNKKALEEAQREVRARSLFSRLTSRISSLSTPVTGAGVGLAASCCAAAFLMDGPHPPAAPLIAVGTVWGFMAGAMFDWALMRGRLVARALRGEPVGQEGVRLLLERRR